MKETKKDVKCGITDEQLGKLKKEIAEALSTNRHKLLLKQPFIGNIAMRFDLVPVRDRRCLTACTDFRRIYFNCDFYLSLSNEERIFVLAHEVWHTINLTSQRKQSRDPELWNIATDMEINNILVSSGTTAYTPPEKLMFPPKNMQGQSAETLYDWLLKSKKNNNFKNAMSKMDTPNKNGKNGNSGDSDDSEKNKNGSGKNGVDTGKLEGQFDKHTYEDDGDGKADDSGKGPSDRWGEMGYDEDFKPSIPADAAERMREATISAAQAYQRDHGDLPAGVEGIIGKLTKPEISWKELLNQFVSQCYGGRRQYLPPARRHVWHDAYFQSRRNERIKGVIAIDTSGSCVDMLPKFFGELKGLIDSFGSYELTVICADAAVDQVDVYDDENNPLELDSTSEIKWSGGGGTDYGPVFEYVEEEQLAPDFLIYLGDGYAGMSYDKQPQYPVMWIITKDGSFDFCDWGKKIRFKESAW